MATSEKRMLKELAALLAARLPERTEADFGWSNFGSMPRDFRVSAPDHAALVEVIVTHTGLDDGLEPSLKEVYVWCRKALRSTATGGI